MAVPEINLGLLIEPDELLAYLDHPQLRIVDLSRSSVYEQLHLAHAYALRPAQLIRQEELATGLLPDQAQLEALIRHLSLSPSHHVVVYDDEGGAWAGRLIWTLHCLGFTQTSLLNGGIHAWLGAGLPTTSEVDTIEPVSHLYPVDTSHAAQYQIQYDELRALIDSQSVQLWDCRTHDEYTGLRLAARRGGHMPGALHFEWSTALNRENHLKLHPFERTQHRLQQLGFRLDQPVIVYCQSHHRSGLAYILARLLDWPVRAYDGAWSEWGNRLDSPVITGEQPF
ncbi:sulfurtransferase [Acinetobacter soli]|uniref:sulfurtransferase n=1 Tax=Acinetobacter soli TaxID=487316 RepID=UPI0030164A87